ncbi:hypothetical protein [Planktomarina sp.]|uniref:hypothetical protein n=1 Tax=Planktomarina sp. TaxID=2024851 RepID=UPI003260437C
MNISTNPNSSFPSQVVSDEEKKSFEYGVQVGRAIEGEWFHGGRSGNRFATNWNRYHNLRLYARGEQPIQKYKDELSINGDLSYLNLDWKPVPVISKFVDIVVNGMSEKKYKINAYAQDPSSLKERTNYAENLLRDIVAQEDIQILRDTIGVDTSNFKGKSDLPETPEDVSLYMQLKYKPSIEIAEEEAINNALAKNKFELVRRRFNYDLTVLGIAAVKTDWNKAEGVVADYCDPAKMVWSYTEDPNFEDIYYVGEVKSITIPELKKQYPFMSEEELDRISKMGNRTDYVVGWNDYDENTVQILYFEYKTYMNQVFKLKHTANGLEKVIEKTDSFDPPPSDTFKKVSRTIEVLFTGAKILGYDQMIDWRLSENMTRPKSDTTKVQMNYAIAAPRMYKGRIESTVSKITGFADMINITNLKIQQVMSKLVPDGVYLDVDGLAEVDLGNGTSYNPQEALNMYFQTGSILGRSLTQEGDMNRGKVPIQELNSSSGQAKLGALINVYQYYLQMIRDVTGLNEARDGSAPMEDTLVGLQKLAANASNVATRHILQSSLYLIARTCENISLRISDSVEFALTNQSLRRAISSFNVGTLEEVSSLHLHDFGIYLELEPEEEEKAQLEQNIQASIKMGGIDIEDAIDIRQINNLKLANEVLKQKRKQRKESEQKQQQNNIQMQAQANAEAAEKSAMFEVQKQQALTQEKISIEQAKAQFEIQRLQTEAEIKRGLMQAEFDFNMQLAQVRANADGQKEQSIEDRKDKRIKIQGTQQSELINQRKNNLLPTNFESSGNDVLGGIGLEQFEPK